MHIRYFFYTLYAYLIVDMVQIKAFQQVTGSSRRPPVIAGSRPEFGGETMMTFPVGPGLKPFSIPELPALRMRPVGLDGGFELPCSCQRFAVTAAAGVGAPAAAFSFRWLCCRSSHPLMCFQRRAYGCRDRLRFSGLRVEVHQYGARPAAQPFLLVNILQYGQG